MIDNANKYCDSDGTVSVQLAAVKENAGYGIGLSMAQPIVHNLNGRINAKCADGWISLVVNLGE